MFGVAVESLAPILTVCVLTIYLLIEGKEVGGRLARLLPRKRRRAARQVVSQLGDQVGGYMRGQMITSALAGLVSLVLLAGVGVQEPIALAVLAAVADAVPVLGLLIAMVPSALVALTLAPSKALLVVVVMLVYHQLEANLIAPRVYGNTMGLSLSTILVSLMIGYQLMGILGMFLALPVAAGLPSVFSLVHEWESEEEPVPNPVGPAEDGKIADPEKALLN
jgi:predicted PurR-regulated permease PerM